MRFRTSTGTALPVAGSARTEYSAAILAFLDEVDGVQTRRAVMLPGSMAPGGSIKD